MKANKFFFSKSHFKIKKYGKQNLNGVLLVF